MDSRNVSSLIFLESMIIIIAVFLFAGCGGAKLNVMPQRELSAPPVAYCHDGVGHIPGHKPFILGGNCCCTPTEERFESYKQEGTVPADMTYDQFLEIFRSRNIITDLDLKYRGCNCRASEYGTHVVFGGRCMVTPTPGTTLYEEVTMGKRLAVKETTNADKK